MGSPPIGSIFCLSRRWYIVSPPSRLVGWQEIHPQFIRGCSFGYDWNNIHGYDYHVILVASHICQCQSTIVGQSLVARTYYQAAICGKVRFRRATIAATSPKSSTYESTPLSGYDLRQARTIFAAGYNCYCGRLQLLLQQDTIKASCNRARLRFVANYDCYCRRMRLRQRLRLWRAICFHASIAIMASDVNPSDMMIVLTD